MAQISTEITRRSGSLLDGTQQFGVLLGVLLAIGLNLVLMQHYELPLLPSWYLAVGAVALWLLGQLAVLAPAMRAAHVPSVVATRSV